MTKFIIALLMASSIVNSGSFSGVPIDPEPITPRFIFIQEKMQDSQEKKKSVETLKIEYVTETADRIEINQEELDLFERVVMAESGGSGIELQEAVASAIVNRVLSDTFPNTMMDVLTQKSQFSVMFDGALDRYPTSDSVKEAVRKALKQDCIYGATSFYVESLSSQKNVRNMLKYNEVVVIIENVTFLIHNNDK